MSLCSWISNQLTNREKCQQIMSNKEFRDIWDAFKIEHRKYLKSYEENWLDKLDEVKSFFKIHKKRPSTIAKDEKEKVLGKWISDQIQNREKSQKIMSNEKIRDIWDAFKIEHRKYLKSNEENWLDKLEEAKSFFEIHGKRPLTKAKDENEKELGQWISNQIQNRENCRYNMYKEEFRDIWDAFISEHVEYFKSNEEIWHDKFEEAKSFFEIHGKRPSAAAKNIKEKELGSWISTQIQNRENCRYSMYKEEFRDIWDAFISEHIEYFKSNEEIWHDKFEEAKSFFKIHEKRPSKTAKDETEKILGSWISTQLKTRAKSQKSMLNEKIRDLWDAFKMEHIEYFKSDEEIWHSKLEEAKSFFEMHKKRPSKGAKDETEKVLGSWISKQIQNREKCINSMSNEEFRDLWDAFISDNGKYFKSKKPE